MHDETFLFVFMAAMALVALAAVVWLASRLLRVFGSCTCRKDGEERS